MIWQIDANSSPFQSRKLFLFHIRLERLKLIYYGLISTFSKYSFKIGTICLLFLSSHVFTPLELDSNHLGILLWKIVKPGDYYEINHQSEKYSKNINPSNLILWYSKSNWRVHLYIKFTTIVTRYPTSKRTKMLTWKLFFRKKSTCFCKLDLSEAITWQLFKSMSVRL